MDKGSLICIQPRLLSADIYKKKILANLAMQMMLSFYLPNLILNSSSTSGGECLFLSLSQVNMFLIKKDLLLKTLSTSEIHLHQTTNMYLTDADPRTG